MKILLNKNIHINISHILLILNLIRSSLLKRISSLYLFSLLIIGYITKSLLLNIDAFSSFYSSSAIKNFTFFLALVYIIFLLFLLILSIDLLKDLLIYQVAHRNKNSIVVILVASLIYILKFYYICFNLSSVLTLISINYQLINISIIVFSLSITLSLYSIRNINLKKYIEKKFNPSPRQLKLSVFNICLNLFIFFFALLLLYFFINYLISINFSIFIGFLFPVVFCDETKFHAVEITEYTHINSLAYYVSNPIPAQILNDNYLKSLLFRLATDNQDLFTGEESLMSINFIRSRTLPMAHPLFTTVEEVKALISNSLNLTDFVIRNLSDIHKDIIVLLKLYEQNDIPLQARVDFAKFKVFSENLFGNRYLNSPHNYIRANYIYNSAYDYPPSPRRTPTI